MTLQRYGIISCLSKMTVHLQLKISHQYYNVPVSRQCKYNWELICIQRAHCPTLEELIGIKEDTNIAAQQAGHSSITKERIYGISTGYLGKLPKNLVEPYANTSSEWQILMKVPERGKDVYLYQYPDKKI